MKLRTVTDHGVGEYELCESGRDDCSTAYVADGSAYGCKQIYDAKFVMAQACNENS